jgi:hypothetical protein
MKSIPFGMGEIRLRRMKYFALRNVKYLPVGQILRKKAQETRVSCAFIFFYFINCFLRSKKLPSYFAKQNISHLP